MIPSFRNDIEAAHYAALHRPLHHALAEPQSPAYAQSYGARVAAAAEACRLAARRGDNNALGRASHSLSMVLFKERPETFETRAARPARA